jgi:thiol-disulfide isomerase/thioredoxin
MRILLLLLSLAACPAKLESSAMSDDTTAEQPPSEPPEFGVNERDDCDQAAIGSSVCNLVLLDQNGEVWELYDYTGKIIILDFSTVWCYPCQMAGHHTQPIQDDYAEDVVFVTLLIDGATHGEPPTAAELTEWVNGHNITTAPVLQASRDYVMDPAGITGYLVGGYPTYVYIDHDMKIIKAHVGFSEEYMRSILDNLLGL